MDKYKTSFLIVLPSIQSITDTLLDSSFLFSPSSGVYGQPMDDDNTKSTPPEAMDSSREEAEPQNSGSFTFCHASDDGFFYLI